MRTTAALGSLAALLAAVVGVAAVTVSPAPAPAERKVRLAVLVVFDQMRGDYLARWRPLFGPNGFARLQRDGAWFTHCHYPYAVTTTGPGHASMLTGACPDAHGIVNNTWREDGGGVNCVDNARYRPVFPPNPNDKAKPAETGGAPVRLLSETVADTLKEAHGGAKVFGLSLKDRSAILPTGRRPDGAYWFSNGAFGTSTYYTERRDAGRVHPWVKAFNDSKAADRWAGAAWERARPGFDYTAWCGPDDVPGEGANPLWRVFPHQTHGGGQANKAYYEELTCSPFGNDLLLEFAKKCVTAEGLGSDDVPDLLVVSFSSNDLIGHRWGPDSQEVMDVTLRSDAIVADLLAFLDATVGKGRYLLGLTADHGVCPLPEVSRADGTAPDAARVDGAKLQERIEKHLTARFPTPKPAAAKAPPWVESLVFPWVYLNPKLVAASGRPREAVAAEAANAVAGAENVLRTFTRTELAGAFPESDAVANRMKRSFHPARCGDVAVVLRPYCIESKPAVFGASGTSHGTPFNYDTHVPLLVYGPGIRGGARSEPTTPQALARVFAKWLNVRAPKDAAFPLPRTLE